ncbi:hypothetical protein [Xylophilus sp. ASV27]|uniref:hypothetical protein n=1 Tax=Xylophilus sp. ASV27 TaxID=2795129 RepID=UPI001E621516|nr:hypothetical protein [Xylophilus sp. ASV27]
MQRAGTKRGAPAPTLTMDTLAPLSDLGLTLPTPAYIAGAILFGLVGLIAWRLGRREARRKTQWIGVALMFYPYAVSSTWLLYTIGLALCAGLWWDWP